MKNMTTLGKVFDRVDEMNRHCFDQLINVAVAFPFYPMSDEILKKLSRVMQDSNLTEKSSEPQPVISSQELNSASEINPPHLETNSPCCLTYNRYK